MTPFLQLIFSLIVIITRAKAGGWLTNRLRQPAVLEIDAREMRRSGRVATLAGLGLAPALENTVARGYV